MARRPDPLATLCRLHTLEVMAGRRAVAEQATAERHAEAASAAATAALATEAVAAGAVLALHPADYAAWLPRGREQAARREAEHALATRATEAARETLAAARAAEGAAESLLEARRMAALRLALRRAQARLDEIAASGTARRG